MGEMAQDPGRTGTHFFDPGPEMVGPGTPFGPGPWANGWHFSISMGEMAQDHGRTGDTFRIRSGDWVLDLAITFEGTRIHGPNSGVPGSNRTPPSPDLFLKSVTRWPRRPKASSPLDKPLKERAGTWTTRCLQRPGSCSSLGRSIYSDQEINSCNTWLLRKSALKM